MASLKLVLLQKQVLGPETGRDPRLNAVASLKFGDRLQEVDEREV